MLSPIVRSKSLYFALAALTLTACDQAPQPAAQQQQSNKPVAVAEKPEELVAKRALERIAAIAEGRLETAYSYYSPGSKQTVSLSSFVARQTKSPAMWKSGNVMSVVCEPEVCEVNLELTYIYVGSITQMAGQEQQSKIQEKWVLSDGQWALVYQPK